MVRRAGSEIIDVTYALDARPEAVIRAPWLEQELGEGHPVELVTTPVVIAHPASVVLGLLLVRLHKHHKIRRANATIMEPASERGRRGMDELHEQTVNLLSFQQLPTMVFGTQVAFNRRARLWRRGRADDGRRSKSACCGITAPSPMGTRPCLR